MIRLPTANRIAGRLMNLPFAGESNANLRSEYARALTECRDEQQAEAIVSALIRSSTKAPAPAQIYQAITAEYEAAQKAFNPVEKWGEKPKINCHMCNDLGFLTVRTKLEACVCDEGKTESVQALVAKWNNRGKGA